MQKIDEKAKLPLREEQTQKLQYEAPLLRKAGEAIELVQGCGGSSGQDRNSYRIFCE